MSSAVATAAPAYFRITLIRSAIGLPSKTARVLRALGLRKRMSTVFHPVSPHVVGQIMRVKELIAVAEVDRALTKSEIRAERQPDHGFYVEQRQSSILQQLATGDGTTTTTSSSSI